jgi:alanine-synthesizing transaminase
VHAAGEYLNALELLASLRLCSNVMAQWAIQTALGGHQSIGELVAPGGRLYESRAVILEAVQRSRYLTLAPPKGAMYAFVGVDAGVMPGFDDQRFALDLLEQKHVLVAPGVSFNVPYRNHFRITNLPDAPTLREVFGRVEELLGDYASAGEQRPGGAAGANVVSAESRFK